jgi:hypothetical protein
MRIFWERQAISAGRTPWRWPPQAMRFPGLPGLCLARHKELVTRQVASRQPQTRRLIWRSARTLSTGTRAVRIRGLLEAPLVDVGLLVLAFSATFQGAYSLIEVSLPGKEHTGAKDFDANQHYPLPISAKSLKRLITFGVRVTRRHID